MTNKLQRPIIRVRGRSFVALVLAPEPPIAEWLAALDAQVARSTQFFDGRPVIVDLGLVSSENEEVPNLISALHARHIRVIGVEGADHAWSGEEVWGRPPMALTPEDRVIEFREAAAPVDASPSCLIIDEPVRSGQTIAIAGGDLTIVGSVASGAELIAGGSIHVYGALRGRAIAGLATHQHARIFCRRMEAELLAINGVYKSADDMDQALRGRAVQAWLEDETLLMAALD